MKSLLLPLLPAILSTTHIAAAQRTGAAVALGTRVRLFVVDTINQASGELRFAYPAGRIAGFDNGSLILRSDSSINRTAHVADSLRVPMTNIGHAEAFTGMKRHPVRGALIGLVLGGTIGYVAGHPAYGGGYSCYEIAGSQFCGTSTVHPETQLRSGASFGGLGALVGGGFGYLIRTEHWSEIDIGQLRFQVEHR